LTGKSVTINELAQKMMNIVDVKVKINYQNLASGDPEQSNGSTNKMVALFKVKTDNFIKLDQGLMSTIEKILR